MSVSCDDTREPVREGVAKQRTGDGPDRLLPISRTIQLDGY